jgi:hypothetical protein
MRVNVALGKTKERDAARELLSRDPGDPLTNAMALRFAQQVGDDEVERRALSALGALLGPDK